MLDNMDQHPHYFGLLGGRTGLEDVSCLPSRPFSGVGEDTFSPCSHLGAPESISSVGVRGGHKMFRLRVCEAVKRVARISQAESHRLRAPKCICERENFPI